MKNDIRSLVLRYSILILIGIFLEAIYLIFTPITIKPAFNIIGQLYESKIIENNVILINSHYAKIVPACVAGSAYYLLLILNLSTPMALKKRTFNLLYLITVFLFLNIFRIVLFVALWLSGFEYFDLFHQATWYFGSTILVVIIWFSSTRLFKIKEIPIYSDIKSIKKYLR